MRTNAEAYDWRASLARSAGFRTVGLSLFGLIAWLGFSSAGGSAWGAGPLVAILALAVAARGATFNRGAFFAGRWPNRWAGHYGWHRPLYGWGGAYSYYSDYPSGYGSSSSGSYPYGDSYLPSGSGDSGSSDSSSSSYQPTPSSPMSNDASSSVSGDGGAANTDKETGAAERHIDQARRAFQKGDYAEAQRECERAIRLQRGDANLHEFLALCQFARGNYKDAAATLYEVLAAGGGWDWDTLSSFYAKAQTYTTQLRTLERYVSQNPREAAGHFALAYHYLVLDERDAATEHLQAVVKLQPKDQVSPGLLEALDKAKDARDAAVRRPGPGR